MLVAIIAVVLALGGTAAAKFGPFKGDKIIKKHSLSGNRLKNNSVTGTQIKSSTLGKVPSAANADTAGGLTGATIVHSANVTNPNNSQDEGTVTCPSGTSAITSGVVTQGGLGQNVNSFGIRADHATAFGWVNNQSGTASTFEVWATCIKTTVTGTTFSADHASSGHVGK